MHVQYVPFVELEVKGQCYFLPLSDVDQSIDPKVKLIGHKEMTNLKKTTNSIILTQHKVNNDRYYAFKTHIHPPPHFHYRVVVR